MTGQTEPEIINCHTHLFTRAHVPRHFPHPILAFFGRIPWLPKTVERVLSFLGQEKLAEKVARLRAFGQTGGRVSQEAVFQELRRYYPAQTRFVVLPLDMTYCGHGPVEKDLDAQLSELADLKNHPKYGHQIIPFATLDPRDKNGFDRLRRAIEEQGFQGLKLYPRMGFMPTDPLLMETVFPYCEANNIPVLSHCSRGGVFYKYWTDDERNDATDPRAFIPVLNAFNNLRLNLAHFGGVADWEAYLNAGVDPDPDPSKKPDRNHNWVNEIRIMLRNEAWPHLYTDISYTVFGIRDFVPILDLFLNEEKIAERVLFGSDFYMTRQEDQSEKAISMRLRSALGDQKFFQIAHANPRRWLAET